MKKLLLCLMLVFAIGGARAQSTDDKGAAASAIVLKGYQLELLNQLLPLLFTKNQWNKVLTAVESCREVVKSTERNELEELKKLDAKLTAAYTAAVEKGELPKPEILNELHGKFAAFETTRRFMAAQNIDKVFEVFNAVANTGQKKTAMNSLDPKRYGKVEEMKDDDKLKLFISEVILNPISYDLMRKLSTTAQGG